jgi:hypothetical protein
MRRACRSPQCQSHEPRILRSFAVYAPQDDGPNSCARPLWHSRDVVTGDAQTSRHDPHSGDHRLRRGIGKAQTIGRRRLLLVRVVTRGAFDAAFDEKVIRDSRPEAALTRGRSQRQSGAGCRVRDAGWMIAVRAPMARRARRSVLARLRLRWRRQQRESGEGGERSRNDTHSRDVTQRTSRCDLVNLGRGEDFCTGTTLRTPRKRKRRHRCRRLYGAGVSWTYFATFAFSTMTA